MFAPSELSPRVRNVAAGLIQRSWDWISAVGMVSPDDAAGRRFRSLGRASGLCFPPGALYGERWISIGAETMIGPHASMAVGMPGETLDVDAPPVITIGDRCNIGRANYLVARCGIDIADDVMTGPNVYITDHNHTYDDPDVPISRQYPEEAPVAIGAGSWLAAGVVVLPGTRIGRNVTVAAGSVVSGTVPDRVVIAGAPARVIRRYAPDTGWTPPRHTRETPSPPPDWPSA